MKSDPRMRPLGDFVRLISGNTPSKADESYWNGDTPWISAKDMANFWIEDSEDHLTPAGVAAASRLVSPGTVLMLTRGMTLHKRVPICRTAQAATFNQDVKAVLPREGLSARFLPYLLVGNHDRLHERVDAAGHGTGRLNTDALLAFPVWVPAPLEQDAIASIGEALDERLRLLRETNATLEAIAQALFKSWFVDFDPVRAKMAGRAPEGMDEATAALFPDVLEETELGLVPKGWKLVPFGELLSHTIGGDWGSDAPDEKNDTRVAIIRGTDIPDLQSGGANRVPVRYTSAKKLASRSIQDGDIVLEVSGGSKDQPTGRSLYMTEALLGKFECPVEPASFCRLFRPTSRGLGVLLSQHLTFIYAAGKTWEYQNQSTGIANFQTTHFLEKELVAVPGEEVLDSFTSLVRPMVDRVHAAQISELSELRDTLLPRLISGQLRLPEAQAQLEDALA